MNSQKLEIYKKWINDVVKNGLVVTHVPDQNDANFSKKRISVTAQIVNPILHFKFPHQWAIR